MTTSELFFTQNADGSASIGYEDYNLEIFSSSNYEAMYYLDRHNFDLLLKSLPSTEVQDTKERLIEEFGFDFDSKIFEDFCNKNNIKFTRHIHID